jgi:hypothetical protein
MTDTTTAPAAPLTAEERYARFHQRREEIPSSRSGGSPVCGPRAPTGSRA